MRQLRTPFSDARAPATATARALLSATPSAATWSPTTARKSSPGMATPDRSIAICKWASSAWCVGAGTRARAESHCV